MTPDDFKEARWALNVNNTQLAEMLGASGSRIIRKWASGETPVPGPVSVLIMLAVDDISIAKTLYAKTKRTRENTE